ncbi:hypothetical protein [Ruegeria arenilitoris]|uniref:hypothetical protein n=1 Tax=Ruegeria arenilitoris TaxID=1173585 RepID=UPI00147C1D52|nr:hypothetical protein [Ruegeria arenilitoris]
MTRKTVTYTVERTAKGGRKFTVRDTTSGVVRNVKVTEKSQKSIRKSANAYSDVLRELAKR